MPTCVRSRSAFRARAPRTAAGGAAGADRGLRPLCVRRRSLSPELSRAGIPPLAFAPLAAALGTKARPARADQRLALSTTSSPPMARRAHERGHPRAPRARVRRQRRDASGALLPAPRAASRAPSQLELIERHVSAADAAASSPARSRSISRAARGLRTTGCSRSRPRACCSIPSTPAWATGATYRLHTVNTGARAARSTRPCGSAASTRNSTWPPWRCLLGLAGLRLHLRLRRRAIPQSTRPSDKDAPVV